MDTPVYNFSSYPNSSYSYNTTDYFTTTGVIIITLYAIIFLFSISGNTLVILTLIQNRRMRTVTNFLLLNLSIGDLLMAVFCMPFTLIPIVLRNFIFGEFMCVTIRYLQGFQIFLFCGYLMKVIQGTTLFALRYLNVRLLSPHEQPAMALLAVSVCVSCFTLVAISLERYFAICEPLQSRRWQTLSHAYRTISSIWICALILMIPIAIGNEVITLKTGNKACREIWAKHLRPLQMTYSILLAMILLVFPLVIMAIAYGGISYKLWFNMKQQKQEQTESTETFIGSTNEIETSVKRKSTNGGISVSLRQTNVRSTNTNRKRVIKMLFVIVFEYFVCCSPLYILNTWKVIHYMSIHNKVSDAAWSLILLLNYLSSCIHPITYCFMNKNFRSAFLGVFHCFLSKTKPFGRSCTQMTNMNSSSLARRGNTKIDRDSSKDVS